MSNREEPSSSANKTPETQHRARKRFGQNFLHDPFVIQRIIKAIGPQKNDLMVEIGPGQGALTAELIPALQSLQAIELDRDLIPILNARFAGDDHGLTIHESDALTFDYAKLRENDERPLRIVGNLPYNISTPLIFHLLEHKQHIKDMHFMLQLELVQRLAAEPGTKTYGRLSVLTQYHCQVQQLFIVAPGAFKPPPKVKSAIVRLIPRADPVNKVDDIKQFERILRSAFAMRRKTLRNNLKNLFDKPILDQLNIDLSRRPEQLSIEEFVSLSNQLNQLAD